MNPDQLKAFIQKNKVALGGAGAAAVAGLAYLRSRAAKEDPDEGGLPKLGSALSAGGAPVSGDASSSYYPVSYVGASGGYDSTASDVYNGLQPQLEAIYNLMAKQLAGSNSPIPITVPPGTTTPSTPTPVRAGDPLAYQGSIVGRVTGATANGVPSYEFAANTDQATAAAAIGYGGRPFWTQAPDGPGYVNQWGNRASSIDAYGTPIQ